MDHLYVKPDGSLSIHQTLLNKYCDRLQAMTKSKGIRRTKKVDPIDRLLRRIDVVDGPLSTQCWVARYSRCTGGYATMSNGRGGMKQCHLVSYDHFKGDRKKGMHIDHLCRVVACCNPDHLEQVTPKTNQERGVNPKMKAHLTNTCKRGHSLQDAYLYKGCRQCRQCARLHQQELKRKRHLVKASHA